MCNARGCRGFVRFTKFERMIGRSRLLFLPSVLLLRGCQWLCEFQPLTTDNPRNVRNGDSTESAETIRSSVVHTRHKDVECVKNRSCPLVRAECGRILNVAPADNNIVF